MLLKNSTLISFYHRSLKPLEHPGFLKLFLVILFLLVAMLSIFIRPGNLDASDLMLIAWEPGQELLSTGGVYAAYPYPLWTVVVMLPIVVWPPQTSMLIMFICNMLMLAASLALFFSIFDWVLSPAFLVLIVSFSTFFLPVLTSLWIGQLTIFSLFILVLTIYFYLGQRWFWLGIALGLSFIKPQIMILLAGLLLLYALWQRRWKVLAGFGLVIFFLLLISLPFISSPAQIIGGGIGSHLEEYILRTSTIWGLLMTLGIPWFVPLMFSLGLIVWLGFLWLSFLQGKEITRNRAIFLFSMAIMVNLIVIPYSWMHNLAMLLLPVGYGLSLILKLRSALRLVWFGLVFFLMHPLMIALFLGVGIPLDTQAYQIIPALFFMPMMVYLETHMNKGEK